MGKNLVIVESPAKAKTISGFLGKDFVVKSSFGHVRDLSKKQLGVDIGKNFLPQYEIDPDKKKIIAELKKSAKEAEVVWLASDEDREGEAISWHLMEVLELEKKKVRRIVFHEITKTAITQAIENPREIDMHLVDAQQARRVLDRLVGFELSPLLWKKVKPSLSAGRVQSVAVRLIVEREKEIEAFNTEAAYRVTARFIAYKGEERESLLDAEYPERFRSQEEALAFLQRCVGAEFSVSDVEKKPARRSPAPPFITSTLQQEASRKLGFSVSRTMTIAQQLYESGKITYMRTDSVHLSEMALGMARQVIGDMYGQEYVKTRQFTTSSKGAQEAHEAIRPTYLQHPQIEGSADQKKLYDLIWKRTIASQMSDAVIERTLITILANKLDSPFQAKGEVILFDGFLKVYFEGRDEDDDEAGKGVLPALSAGEMLHPKDITATERFSKAPPRYTEASLVKKLEELGIGRPSTYAPTISTILKREYVVKEDRPGTKRDYNVLVLKGNHIKEDLKHENIGYEKAKLFPTDIGTLVNEFLMMHFDDIMDYNFTASVEKQFDEIAEGQKVWNEMIRQFYAPFHQRIEKTGTESSRFSGEKLLGVDPATGKKVYAKVGRYGPMIQIGDNDDEDKPRFAALRKGGPGMQQITLEDALELFRFPRVVGTYEDKDITVGIGRFGPFVKHNNKFYSIPRGEDPGVFSEEASIALIEQKRKEASENLILEFPERPEVKVLKGRYGPYISFGKQNVKIPKGTEPSSLSLQDCERLAAEAPPPSTKKGSRKKS